jgi:hypothetical protein
MTVHADCFVIFLPKDNTNVKSAVVIESLSAAHAELLLLPAQAFWTISSSAPFCESLDSYLRFVEYVPTFHGVASATVMQDILAQQETCTCLP